MRYAPNPSKPPAELLTATTGMGLAFSRSTNPSGSAQLCCPALSSARCRAYTQPYAQPYTPENPFNFCWLPLRAAPTPSGCSGMIQTEKTSTYMVPLPAVPFWQGVEESHLHRTLWHIPLLGIKTSKTGEESCGLGESSVTSPKSCSNPLSVTRYVLQ